MNPGKRPSHPGFRQAFRHFDRALLPGGEQRTQVPRPLGRPQLTKRLRLDLADALARNVELLTDFFQSVFALAADTETQADDLLLFGRQGL